MRALRSLAAVLIWLVASLLLVLSIVLCITILLLPVGILLGLVSLRLYAVGFGLLLPRSRDIEKGVRKQARRWWRKSPLRELSRRRTRRGTRKIMRLGR
jgi:hypothetical protein